MDRRPHPADLVAILCALGLVVLLADVVRNVLAPPAGEASVATITLAPSTLPYDALCTTARLLAGLALALPVALLYGVLAVRSRTAGLILVPALDVLQSVPILGYLTFSVVVFMGLFPGTMAGGELAAIAAICAAQVWTIAFGFHRALTALPTDLGEVARGLRLTSWQRFWRVELPYCVPSLTWSAVSALSGGWFMVVYAETITVGGTHVVLPGLGSYVAEAIARSDLRAVVAAIAVMAAVLVACDQILFRPLLSWSERYRTDQRIGLVGREPWALALVRRAPLVRSVVSANSRMMTRLARLPIGARPTLDPGERQANTAARRVAMIVLAAGGLLALARLTLYGRTHFSLADIGAVLVLGGFTLLRVLAMLGLATLVWVPVGVWIGLRPSWAVRARRIGQLLAAFPANLFYPLFVAAIVTFDLTPDLWLTPLIVLGAQWYILFSVIDGTSGIPREALEVARLYRVRGLRWWTRIVLPAIAPSVLGGALMASGVAWNAAIAAEVARWGDTSVHAHGLGAYIAVATRQGAFNHVGLGMVVMAAYVVGLNRLVWHPARAFAERRYTLYS
ncbi:ABC transporter anion transporter permease [Ameyamaea chiangmaiensis NBRC 103196]|uniref:ABC transporter permease subunit n=1 Tax=Ameyamaea chiangmaiensis TaxID=442969 RepID=A0A850P353_9PROT|nr:ABC transporter permease subunit [Ameyamaea chiangmaiensis]MBS4073635.1 ABC transporter permease subunit [Ameyamaea chiangmaiensis]NVN39097.1 ABC transporter permease subunit [Ameyamaea chiangmaiensis]GBQ68990.1 ABC transporter anion transporter permease [Ameyamaea chiangmaiensis NBRC 103196]